MAEDDENAAQRLLRIASQNAKTTSLIISYRGWIDELRECTVG